MFYRDQPLRGVNPHVAIVFQSFALFPWLTVQENVEVALKARGVPQSVATPRALYRLKRDTLRPLDRRDAAMLAERFGLKETD